VDEVILEWTRRRTTREVVNALAPRVPVGPVNNAADIFADPHVKVREMLVEIEQPGNNRPITLAGSPIKLTATPSGVYRRPPNLGEHSEEILAEAAAIARQKETT
jgi:crotonobetainyl-CoA:carnitine CoA-transferase CaiB-like acyl-CoA transferase